MTIRFCAAMSVNNAVPGYGVRMWKVAVVIPTWTAQSTVRREDIAVVSVQAEDEAAVDHDAEAVEPAHDLAIAAAEVLALAGALEAAAGKRFEADKQTSQTGGSRLFDHIIAQDRVDCCGALKDAAHPSHAAEEISREPRIPEEMIVQEVEMPAGKAGNFGERVVHDAACRTSALPRRNHPCSRRCNGGDSLARRRSSLGPGIGVAE